MFCPKCATQNVDGASFCRSCGANVSLIPQALSGQALQAPESKFEEGCGRKQRRRELSLDHAFKNAFMGLAFLLIALALAFTRMGAGWWFWMLIPAFSMMGTGVAQYIRIREREKRAFQPGNFGQSAMQPPQNIGSVPAPQTGQLIAPPPSVTEGTTRHLGAEAPTKHFGASSEVPK